MLKNFNKHYVVKLLGAEFNWTVTRITYYLVFRFDCLNRSWEEVGAVPLQSEETSKQNRVAWQGTDHAGTNSFSLDNRFRESASLLFMGRNLNQRNLLPLVRRYSCKVGNDNSKWDSTINVKALTCRGQETGDLERANLRELHNLKQEIRNEVKNLIPILVLEIKKGLWPMLKYNKRVCVLVTLKQKYLALLSSEYGLHSTRVETQVADWLSNLDMRIFAIETVYRSIGSKTPGIDGIKLSKENLLNYIDALSIDNLLEYKGSGIRRVFVPKSKGTELRPLGIPTIEDRIVQTLFVQVIEPIIDPYADVYSFGYRKGRSAHQAIGELSRILQTHPYLRRKSKAHRYFSHTKHVLQVDIKGFFDNVNHEFLLKNYPIPKKFKGILKEWLAAEVYFQDQVEQVITGFPQGSVIGPSLANFTLNGLEGIIAPSQVTSFDREKYKPGQSVVRKKLINRIIRFADDFIIICNDEYEVKKIKKKLQEFLAYRGLKINEEKGVCVKWVSSTKINYLGFTFHYINTPRLSRITEQRKSTALHMRGGLYVYPSDTSVMKFKKKISDLIKINLNWSPYRIIESLNPIIRGWGNYFGIGTLRQFSRLDHYIYYRTWRYLRMKFKKVPVGILVDRFYQGVVTPSGRVWQFHGIWNKSPENLTKRKGNISWLLILCKLVKPMPGHRFRAKNEVLKTSFYINPNPYKEWVTWVFEKRNVGQTSNKWSELYKRQKGICTECEQFLGYLLEDNLEIHHIEQVSKLGLKDQMNQPSNFVLIHKSCYRAVPVVK